MSTTYSAGYSTAYGAAKRGGYTGTYAEFCEQQATYAENAAAVETAVTNAEASATAAANSATAAAASESNAATSETNAATSETNAAASESAAATSETNAATSESNAESYATSAAASATSAAASAALSGTATNIADGYDSTATYAVGEYVLYGDVLYRCTTAWETAGDFDSDYWEEVTVGEELTDTSSALRSETCFLALEQGSIVLSSGTPLSSTAYVRTITEITTPMHIDAGDGFIVSATYVFTSDGAFSSGTSVGTQACDVDPDSDTYVKLTFRRTDSSTITPEDLQPSLFATKMHINAINTESNTDVLLKTTSHTAEYVTGYLIDTSSSYGTTIDTTPTANTSFAYIILPCHYGDEFVITGQGGSTGRLWSFIDENDRQRSFALAGATETELTVTAPCTGYFISNVKVSADYSLIATQRINVADVYAEEVENCVNITDLKKLDWIMGTFVESGVQGGTFTDRMYTICKVKKGGTIVADSTNGVKIKFGYKIDEDETTLRDYVTFNYQTITIPDDCIMYLGVVYAPATYLNNLSILDNLTADIDVVDYKSKYLKGDSCNYGRPSPRIQCVGQHTDETGWTNATVDVDEIHAAFDELVTASNGYITVEDLGVAYDTYHAYAYTADPVPLHVSDLEVPTILITCCMHGNEKMSAYVMHYLLYDLVYNSTKNPVLAYLRANCKLIVVPITNPYGFINTTRLNENGVNINRNFPADSWDDYSEDGSEYGGNNYKGESAASETQTIMIMDFVRNNPDASAYIDLHTNGTDTSYWYEVTSTMVALPTSEEEDIEIGQSYIDASKIDVNYIKPWLDENYGTDLGNVYYGNVVNWNDEPYVSAWTTEATHFIGITFEVMAGSSTEYLGTTLTKYAPATIKANAEIFGNYLMAICENCKEH